MDKQIRDIAPYQEGFTVEKLTIDMGKANIWSISLLLAMAPIVVAYGLLWGFQFDRTPKYLMLLCLFFVVGIVVHELIHGAAWMLASRCRISDISFGVLWKYLAPYCHCNKPMLLVPYLIGALAPLVIVGVIPTVIGLAIGNRLCFLLGVIFIVAAVGDIMIVWNLRHEDRTILVYDHPSEAGCFVYRKNV